MPDINELFDRFPDYDVFTGKTVPAKPPGEQHPPERPARQPSGQPVRQPVRQPARQPMRQPVHQPVQQPAPVRNTDYRDGYGMYRERKTVKNNYMTAFLFPAAIMWMELFLKIGVGAAFDFMSVIYTVLFSVAVGCFLTFFCSFAKAKTNRRIANIILFLLTAVFVFQLVYFDKYTAFFTFSGANTGGLGFSDITKGISDKLVYFIAIVFPFLFSLTIGRLVFKFGKVKLPAKVSLLMISAMLIVLASAAINFDKGASRLFNGSLNARASHGRFGLMATEYMDIKSLFS